MLDYEKLSKSFDKLLATKSKEDLSAWIENERKKDDKQAIKDAWQAHLYMQDKIFPSWRKYWILNKDLTYTPKK